MFRDAFWHFWILLWLWCTADMGKKNRNENKLTTRMNGKSRAKASPANDGLQLEFLLDAHRRHHGIFARVARNLSLDPSYVSRVANGKRRSPVIERALAQELRRITGRS